MGAAYFVLGWAQGAQGKEGAEALMLKSLEAFRRSGNRVRQANALSNVGGVCYWEGRWEDAMAYYERGRDESMKVGILVNAATSSMNIAEILTDRGEHAEAEAMLQKTLPVWKSSEYRYFQGACHWMLGSVSLRAGRIDEALARFDEANVYTTNMAEFLKAAAYRNTIYTKQFPTGTWLEVKGLALPEFLIEIELEARTPTP